MFAFLLVLLAMITCSPALAGETPIATPELDPASLAALTSGITAIYFGYRIYRGKTKR